MIFFLLLLFWKRKIAELRVGWIKGSLGGGERFLLLREKERKKEKQKEKKDIHNKKALELIERGGYKSEHKSLAPKKTRCV